MDDYVVVVGSSAGHVATLPLDSYSSNWNSGAAYAATWAQITASGLQVLLLNRNAAGGTLCITGSETGCSAALTWIPTPPPAPTVSTVAVTSSPATGNTYERGENIEVTVTFSAAVDVTGTPRLALTVGGNTRQASHNRGSGAAAQVFRYTVVQTDSDSDGISIGANALSLNSGTINVANGSTAATLTHSAVSAQSGHRVNGALPAAPTVSTVAVTSSPATGNTYERGENIEVTVTFSAAVDVTGTPRLALTVGGDTRQASHNRGSGAAAQVFRY